MIDPMGYVVSILSDRLQPSGDGGPAIPVRSRRDTGTEATPGHPAAPGDSPPFVLVRRLSRVRIGLHRTRSRIVVTAFALNEVQASQIMLRVSPALHLAGPRLRASGVAIYNSKEEIAGQPGSDPDTGWSTEASIYIIHAAAEAVASTP